MNTKREELPELVGTLAVLPEHVKSTIESYGRACFAFGKKAAVAQTQEQSAPEVTMTIQGEKLDYSINIETLKSIKDGTYKLYLHPPKQDVDIDKMVSNFLGWKLPKDFYPDGGIEFKNVSDYQHPTFGRHVYEPIGTNLFTATQAKAMIEHMLKGAVQQTEGLAEAQAEIVKLREELTKRCGMIFHA